MYNTIKATKMYDKNILLQILTNPSFRTIDSNVKVLPPCDAVYVKIFR